MWLKLCCNLFQDPNEDTEWNDVLRKKGIIPQKEAEITEDAIVAMVMDIIYPHCIHFQ